MMKLLLAPCALASAFIWGAQAEEDPYKDLRIIRIMGRSCPSKASLNDTVSVHYDGWLKENYPDGAKFDSSKKRKAFNFKMGGGKVIKGWDEGLKDMCVGEKRLLEVPPHLAYGKKGAGKIIPADSTLVFEVEMLDVTPLQKIAVDAAGAEASAASA